MKKIYSLLFAILFSVVTVFAQTVTLNGVTKTSITQAIADASDPSDVIVISGIHTESISFADKSLTIQGSDPTRDIIQAAASANTATGRVISISAANATNINVTIKNLGIRYGNETSNGGGILIEKISGLVTLENLIIEQNATTANGGGVAIAGADVNFIDCSISANTSSSDGGGLFLASNNGLGTDSDISIKKTVIDSNTGKNGGGIYINGNKQFGDDYSINTTIENSFISNNSSTNTATGNICGGAIAVSSTPLTSSASTTNTALTLIHVTTFNNSAIALVKSGISFFTTATTAYPSFSAYNSILIVENNLNNKAINFGNGTNNVSPNVTAMKNCILGGFNGALPSEVSTGANNNITGNNATFTGISTTLANQGGKVKVLALPSTATNSIGFCTAATGITLPTTDARGALRDASPDAGAFEYATTTISGNTTLSADAVYDELTVSTGVSLTINADVTARVNGDAVNDGSITIESGGALAVLGTVSGAGNATVKRKTTGNAGYSIIGVPVTGANTGALNADYKYTWDGSAWSVFSGTMFPGSGYFIGYDAANPEISLTGPLFSGNKFITGGLAGDNFKIVGNPYAAPIAISEFLGNTANTAKTTGAVYLWDDGGSNVGANRGGDYITVNNLGATVSTTALNDQVAGAKGSSIASKGNIASMQGFFVELKEETGSVTFTPSMQISTSGANADANYYRTSNSENQILKLKLSGNAYANTIIVGLVDGATFDQDNGLDATKYSGNNDFSFYSKLGDKKMAIQGLPKVSTEDISVDLGIDAKDAGEYIFTVEGFEGFGSETQVALYDRHTGQSYILDEKAEVKINITAVNSLNDRFSLSFSNSALLSTESELSKMKVYGSSDELTIRFAGSQERVTIHSLDGKVLFQEVVSFEGEKAVISPALQNNQIYILKVKDQSVKFILK
ncbi:MAG: hypothetical protein RIC03_12265 [Cyclobacteriaceae bacterium]